MARLMLSAGMFSALAARIAVRRRGLPSGSPPPDLEAILISLMRRVKILPRLASVAPFLCLMVAHLLWPDMFYLGERLRLRSSGLTDFSRFGGGLPPSPPKVRKVPINKEIDSGFDLWLSS